MFGERLYACVYTPDVFAVAQTYCVFAVKSLNILCLLHFSVRLLLFSFFFFTGCSHSTFLFMVSEKCCCLQWSSRSLPLSNKIFFISQVSLFIKIFSRVKTKKKKCCFFFVTNIPHLSTDFPRQRADCTSHSLPFVLQILWCLHFIYWFKYIYIECSFSFSYSTRCFSDCRMIQKWNILLHL